jgi:oxygen-independent coproporphyrinogen-3 oxidase
VTLASPTAAAGAAATRDRPRAAYLHVPFCPHVCPYCDFHKMRRDERLVARYLDRLEEEIAEAGARFGGALDSVYLGGGTPSHLSDAELARVMEALGRAFELPARSETTIEADPRTFDAARLRAFRALGIDRLSIGLQSTQDQVLRFLGRAHDAREGLAAVDLGLAAGFTVSADLITAVPGQDVRADLAALAATGVPHVSVYTLTVEPYTPFARRRVHVDDDRAADDYALAADVLAGYGYRRYEVSNHALPGHEAVHNQVYWHGDPFLGLGPSAAGYLPTDDGLGERVTNPPIKFWLRGDPPERERVDARGHALERLMTGLRTARGVDLDTVAARCGVDVRARWAVLLDEELAAGRLELVPADPATGRGATLRATDAGLLVLDAVLRRFFSS